MLRLLHYCVYAAIEAVVGGGRNALFGIFVFYYSQTNHSKRRRGVGKLIEQRISRYHLFDPCDSIIHDEMSMFSEMMDEMLRICIRRPAYEVRQVANT